MQYDQTWMGYGWLGGLEAGGISLLAGVLAYALFRWIGRGNHWSEARQVGTSYVLAVLASARMDLWNLFYFNYGRLQSLQLLKAKLAEVHDPDGIGIRVLCGLAGAAAGVFLSWWAMRRRGG